MNILDSDKWIFLVPVDGNGNKNNTKNNNELLQKEQTQKNQENKENEKDSKEESNKINLNNNDIKKDSDIKNTNENANNSKLYLYSFLSKSKEFSIANSSKIYMSEFLKKNWKIKIKRLILKLKKRYTKQAQKIDFENSDEIINNKEVININNNNISKNDFNKSDIINNSLDFGDKLNIPQLNSNLNDIKENSEYLNCKINNLNITNNQKNYYNYYIVNNNNL